MQRVTSFGANVEILDGVEGLLRVSDFASERVSNASSEILHPGQQLRVKILESDIERKCLKVGMRQVEPTNAGEFRSQIRISDPVGRRLVELDGCKAIVEIANGVRGLPTLTPVRIQAKQPARRRIWEIPSLRALLWSAMRSDLDALADEPIAPSLTKGSVHSFEVGRLNAATGTIHLAQR